MEVDGAIINEADGREMGDREKHEIGEPGQDIDVSAASAAAVNEEDEWDFSESLVDAIRRLREHTERERRLDRGLSTGQQDLDALLEEHFPDRGPIPSGVVVELTGESGAGKSQLCYQLAAAALCENSTNRVVWLDSNGSFRPAHLIRILRSVVAEEGDAESALQRVLYKLTVEAEEVTKAVRTLNMAQSDLVPAPRLVILDSAGGALADTTATKDENRAEGWRRQKDVIRELRSLAVEKCAVVVVTNHYVDSRLKPMPAWLRTSEEAAAQPEEAVDEDLLPIVRRPALGRLWASLINVRLEIARFGMSERAARLVPGATVEAPEHRRVEGPETLETYHEYVGLVGRRRGKVAEVRNEPLPMWWYRKEEPHATRWAKIVQSFGGE